MLTDVQAKAAAAADKDYKLADANGLYLFVTRSGFKSWRMKYRYGGKEKRLTFGAYPEVSLEEARARRDQARRLLRDDIDPAAEKQRLRVAGVIDDPVAAPVDEPPAVAELDEPPPAAPQEPAPQASAPPPPVPPEAPSPAPASRPSTAATPPFADRARVPAVPAEDEPKEAVPFTPEVAAGSRALSLLRQAERAAEEAAHQSRIAKRIAVAVLALLLLTLGTLAVWALTHRDGGTAAPAVAAAVPAASTAASVPPSVSTPPADLSAATAPAATAPAAVAPTPAALPPVAPASPASASSYTPPVVGAGAAASVAPAPIAKPVVRHRKHRRHRRARHRGGRIAAVAPITVRGRTRSLSSQETRHVVEAAPPRGEAIDPVLDRVGRASLCMRAAYSAEPSCLAMRRAGGLLGPAQADAGGSAPQQ